MPDPVTTLKPRRQPRQERARATCEAVLQAASSILKHDGRKALTTNHVAARAGVSVGSLYQYFPGKEAILAALIRQMRREMLDDFVAATDRTRTASLLEATDALLQASIRHHLRDPVLTERLEEAEATLPMDAETLSLKRSMHGLVVELLQRHGIDRPETAALDLIAMCHGMVETAIRHGQNDFDDLLARLRRAVRGYLAVGTI